MAFVLACSDGGSSPTEPDRPEPPTMILALVGQMTTEGAATIQSVTVFLDDEVIGQYEAQVPEGRNIALVGGTRIGVPRGEHSLTYRFDRLGSSPADVKVHVTGIYTPDGEAREDLDFDTHEATVREGEQIRLVITI